MSEIVIDINNLDSEINRLRDLKKTITNNKKKPPNTIGGGSAISNIEKIGNDYKCMEEKMEVLVQNTVGLMENIRNSYLESDIKATKTIR
ncbi:MAG: hypothetical protein K6B67_04915 [Lachnospiraceae bacterium]|nr:hypothetical protein [Lachnospiraceae bacterium]